LIIQLLYLHMYTFSAYHQWSCEFDFNFWRGGLDTTFIILKFVTVLWQFDGVLRALPISSTSYNWNIVERGRTLSTHNPNPVVKQFSKDLPKEKHLKMFFKKIELVFVKICNFINCISILKTMTIIFSRTIISGFLSCITKFLF
jgi:hypothetical protein